MATSHRLSLLLLTAEKHLRTDGRTETDATPYNKYLATKTNFYLCPEKPHFVVGSKRNRQDVDRSIKFWKKLTMQMQYFQNLNRVLKHLGYSFLLLLLDSKDSFEM